MHIVILGAGALGEALGGSVANFAFSRVWGL